MNAVKKGNAIEQAGKDLSSLNAQDDQSLLTVDQGPSRSYVERGAGSSKDMKSTRSFCSYCKRTGHTYDKCFKRAVCGSCGRTGHTTDFCRSKKLATCEDKARPSLRYIKGQFLGKEINFLLDTGASLSILNRDIVKKYG